MRRLKAWKLHGKRTRDCPTPSGALRATCLESGGDMGADVLQHNCTHHDHEGHFPDGSMKVLNGSTVALCTDSDGTCH
jgi:hypothetical protein